MRAHASSRQIASVGVCARFFWGLLLPHYINIEKSIASQPDACFLGIIPLFHFRQRETHMHGQAKKGNLTFDLSSQLFQQRAAFALSICKSWRACRNPAVNNSLETGSHSDANVEALFPHLLEAWKAWRHHPLTQVVDRGERLAVLRGQ